VQPANAILSPQIRLQLQKTRAVAIDPMSSRPAASARIQLAVFALFALLTVAVSLSIDLSKFQERVSTREDQAILQGISNPSELEGALRQHPSNSVLQLMAKALRVADNTKGAIDQLSAQIEPARLSKEPNFGSVSRDELDSFRRDLGTAEANARAFLPRYAAIFKAEHEQIKSATVSFHVPKSIADQLLDGVAQRHAKTLNAISLVLSARADYYRAYDKYIAFLSSELGSFKIVAGQFIFPLQRTVERYNVTAQAMTSAGRRVNELENDMKKQEQPLPEEWAQLTGVK
jgi:hypothetical protein